MYTNDEGVIAVWGMVVRVALQDAFSGAPELATEARWWLKIKGFDHLIDASAAQQFKPENRPAHLQKGATAANLRRVATLKRTMARKKAAEKQ